MTYVRYVSLQVRLHLRVVWLPGSQSLHGLYACISGWQANLSRYQAFMAVRRRFTVLRT
jgi:hypothetical protein